MTDHEQRQTALGLLEFGSVVEGIAALDAIMKTVRVEPRRGQVVNPGKYLLLIAGSFGAVQAAIEHISANGYSVLDVYMLGNPSGQVIAALRAPSSAGGPDTVDMVAAGAVGLLETETVVAAIAAADIVAKTVFVDKLDIRFSERFGGKGVVFFQGETAAVQAGLDAGVAYLANNGTLIRQLCLAHPTAEVIAHLRTDIL
ncbi:MAG TPA: BMC domain-containing protein [Bacilli bacterium]